jgi:uncharacterized protein
MRPLSALEARVLGVLVEKALTVPDTYPLSLNALVAGCNQKTAREVVMNASEEEAQNAVYALKELELVQEVSGSRVTRFQHNLARGLALPSQSVALLVTLVLRGPLTSAELRTNAERFHRFADLSSVEGFLDELLQRLAEKGGPLLVKLPRAPGAREARWAHFLCGEIDLTLSSRTPETVPTGELAALKAEVAQLRELVENLYAELGLNKVEQRGDE